MTRLLEQGAAVQALDHLRNAKRNDTHKGDAFRDWLETQYPETFVASLVTEKKQAYNRVNERFAQKRQVAVFLSLDEAAVAVLQDQVKRRRYPELQAVLLIEREAQSYAPKWLWAAEHSAFGQAIRSDYPDIQFEVMGDTVRASSTSQSDALTRDNLDDRVAWLVERTHLPEPELRDMLDALLSDKPQIVLAGVPGTGKTYVAQLLARAMTGDLDDDSSATDNWDLVQFHPSYAYEDFVEGIRPVVDPDTNLMGFKPSGGKIVQTAEHIERDLGPDETFVLVIDEMNRANLPRVFGELLYLLEYREQGISLQYMRRDDLFFLPRRLALIGTMNTSDRSIRIVDAAFRRRFEAVYELEPSGDVIRSWYSSGKGSLAGVDLERLIAAFENLNKALSNLGLDSRVGHSYFMRATMSPAEVDRVWRRQIRPLLAEYVPGTSPAELDNKYGRELLALAGSEVRSVELVEQLLSDEMAAEDDTEYGD